MKSSKIFITGVAGFIGFNLAQHLLKKNYYVVGIDNFDNYYSVLLKKKRISLLKKNKKFRFNNIDFTNKIKFTQYIKKIKKIDCLVHLGAQAGVRYSLLNPSKYINNNIIGFSNILDVLNETKIKKIIYGSSSSVYGESKKFPLKEKMKINPKNIYAKSKEINEQMANDFTNVSKINLIGLRFFTVFGEWGRPDMFMMKFLYAYYRGKSIEIFNNGNHERDFTYVQDVVKIIEKIINIKKFKSKHTIYNVCSNNPIKLTELVKTFTKLLGAKPKIIKKNLQKADVIKTHGCNIEIKKLTKFNKFTNINIGLKKLISWYFVNKIWKI